MIKPNLLPQCSRGFIPLPYHKCTNRKLAIKWRASLNRAINSVGKLILLAQFLQGATLTVVAVVAFILIGLILTAMILYTKKQLVRVTPCQIKINEDDKLTKNVAGGQTLLSRINR